MRSPLGPGGRPFRGWRFLPFLLSVGAFGAAVVVLLSDRAPGVLRRISSRIDAGVSRASDATGLEVPGGDLRVGRSDFDVHVVIWAVVALLVGLATWSWLSLVVANGTVLAASVVLEITQPLFSRRTLQISDMAGNAVGVLAGTCAVAVFALVWGLARGRAGVSPG